MYTVPDFPVPDFPKALTEAEKKAARDARYAVRKSRKQVEPEG